MKEKKLIFFHCLNVLLLFAGIQAEECKDDVQFRRRMAIGDAHRTFPDEDHLDVVYRLFETGFQNLTLEHRDVTIIIGTVNSGKSALASFLTRQKMVAVMGPGDFILEDENGRVSPTHPHTIYPELYLDGESEIAYYDLPGNVGATDGAYETISKFFTNNLLRYVKSVRILLTVKFCGFADSESIIRQLTRMTDFLNIDKLNIYYESLGLAMTFVETKGTNLVHDDVVRKSTLDALNEALKEIDSTKLDDDTKKAMKTMIAHFAENFENIVIMRRAMGAGDIYNQPTHAGADIVLTAERIQNIKKCTEIRNSLTIFKRYFYSAEEDILFYMRRFVTEVDHLVEKAVDLIKKYFETVVSESTDHTKTSQLFDTWIKTFAEKMEDVEYTCAQDRDRCFTCIFAKIIEMKITLPNKLKHAINRNYRFLVFVEEMSRSKKLKVKTKKWVGKLNDIKSYLTFSKEYFKTLNKFYDGKSKESYSSNQKEKKVPCKGSACGKYVLKKPEKSKISVLKVLYKKKTYPSYEMEKCAHQFDESHKNQMEHTEKMANEVDVTFECHNMTNATAKIQVKGVYLKLSDVRNMFSTHDILQLCKSNYTIERIDLFALDTITIDMDVRQVFAREELEWPVDVTIIAPNWVIQPHAKITFNLTGSRGEPLPELTYFDGPPGLPGGAASAFLGIGAVFSDSGNLVIAAFGGDGGDGYWGASGTAGSNGVDLFARVNCPGFCHTSILKKWLGCRCGLAANDLINGILAGPLAGLYAIVHFKALQGIPGDPGTPGGDGGMGGHPGKGNDINIISVDGQPHSVTMDNRTGTRGQHGEGGIGGLGGLTECDFLLMTMFIFGEIWLMDFCENSYARAESGKDGTDGNCTKGMKTPKEPEPIYHSHQVVNDYKYHLIKHLGNHAKRNDFVQFYYKLENNSKVQDLYTPLGFIMDYINLENQFYDKREDPDYALFFESLLRRVNNFDKLLVNTHEMELRNPNEDTDKIANKTEIGRVNNNISMTLLNGSLQIKINYFKYSKTDTFVELRIINLLAKLQGAIGKYSKLQDAQIKRNETRDSINALMHSVKLMAKKIDKNIKPMFKKMMSDLKDQMDELVEEVDVLIEKSKENMKKLALGAIIKGIISVVGGILSVIPGMGQIGKVVVDVVKQVANTVVDAAIPPEATEIPDVASSMQMYKDYEESQACESGNEEYKKIEETYTGAKKIIEGAANGDNSQIEGIMKDAEGKMTEYKKKFMNLPKDTYGCLKEKGLNAIGNTEIGSVKVKDIFGFLDKNGFLDTVKKSEIAKQLGELENKFVDKLNFSSVLDKVKNSKLWTGIENSVSKLKTGALKLVNNIKDTCSKFIDKGQKIFKKITKALGPFINAIGGVAEDMASSTAAMQKEEDNIKNLINFKKQIQDDLIPMIDTFTDKVDDIDFMSIDVELLEQMDIKGKFDRISEQLDKASKGFEVSSKIKSLINQVKENLNTLVEFARNAKKAKDKVHELAGQKNLVEDRDADNITCHYLLRDSIDDMKLAVQKNLILVDYEDAVRALDILYFPHVSDFSVDYEITKKSEINGTALDDYIKNISAVLTNMSTLCNEYRNFTKQINLKQKYFKRDFVDIHAKPFYTWFDSTNSEKISDLLLGEQVLFYADIQLFENNFDAIKFKEIAINFTLKSSVQNHDNKLILNTALASISRCNVSMIMGGDSKYKCAGKVYSMSTGKMIFNHSFSAIKTGAGDSMYQREYVYESESYGHLRENPPQLSPYGSWEMKIFCDDTAQPHLEGLKGLVDLHLVGFAQYLETDNCPHDIPKFTLNKYAEDQPL